MNYTVTDRTYYLAGPVVITDAAFVAAASVGYGWLETTLSNAEEQSGKTRIGPVNTRINDSAVAHYRWVETPSALDLIKIDKDAAKQAKLVTFNALIQSRIDDPDYEFEGTDSMGQPITYTGITAVLMGAKADIETLCADCLAIDEAA